MAAVTKRASNPNEEEMELRRGPWTIEEDTLLIHYISTHGEGHWNSLAKCAGLKRTGKSCRLRWLNYLKPDIKRGNLTPQEQLTILELHSKWGNRWSKIAQHLPGRTDNEIKNYWRTRVQKQARQLNIESNSKRFLDAVRCFWMPTLIQKMEQNSSQSSSSPSLSANYSSSVPCVSLQASPSAEATQMSDYPMNFGNSNCVTNPPRNILCSDSLISQQPQPIAQMSDYPAPDESYYSYEYDMGMEGLTMDPAFAMGSFDNSQFGCQVGATDWTTDSLWNMDGM